jgi:UDP-N-acetylmuramoylalanine--D-glutamate ligase
MSGYREKLCAVIGLARAGVPTARFLVERGNRVVGYDSKYLSALPDEARKLQNVGVELKLGEHEYAGLQKADLIVLSPGLKLHHEPLKSLLESLDRRHVEIIGELELAARHCPAPMIAVTGTKGKSTTTKLIAKIIEACGENAVRAGNSGIPLIAELPKLTPQSWAVVEVSSFQLERAPTFKPRVAVLLNLLADHQDYHTSLEQYWQTKLKLFAHQNAGDVAVFNGDDARVREVFEGKVLSLPQNEAQRWLSSGHSGEDGAGVRDNHVGWNIDGQWVPVVALEEIPLRGAHNHANVAAALAAVRAALGHAKVLEAREAIADAIRNFASLPHRLEIVAQKDGITWVNDSQATIPDATIQAVQAFPKPVTLIAGGRNKLNNLSGYDSLGQAIAEHVQTLVTIGETAEIIGNAARKAGLEPPNIIHARTLTNAVKNAKLATPESGTVILSPACASFDQFASFEDRGEKFKEAVAAL